MTLRAKSRSRQWKRWLALVAVALAAYPLLSLAFYGAVTLNVFEPRAHRIALPIILAFAYVAWELRWDGVTRKARGRARVEVGESGRNNPIAPVVRVSHARTEAVDAGGCAREDTSTTSVAVGGRAREDTSTTSVAVGGRAREDTSTTSVAVGGRAREDTSTTEDDETGEALYVRARAIPHRPIPEFLSDGRYLDLLGRSAAKGYAPAMAKLGAYAMRRAAWVEAYFWITEARRHGEPDCEPLLQFIRQSWTKAGFPDESENATDLFPEEAGSIGRALLHVATGFRSAPAREFLKDHHPGYA